MTAKHGMVSRPMAALAGLLLLSGCLAGCSLSGTSSAVATNGAVLTGKVYGGQQPVAGSHVYLYAASTAGYNVGAATNSSVSLLQASLSSTPTAGATTRDASGNYYVTSDALGNFTITGDYACLPDVAGVPGQQVYLYGIGGNPGAGINPGAGLMAVLGDCPAAGNFLATTPNIFMDEISTVAAAYSMAGFAYDATHVSSSATTLAKIGIRNAFANAADLASISTGLALATTPAGNGTVPTTVINTLADILASCINSNGAVTGPTSPTACYTLFYNAESGGSTGTVATDTATAAINIAHNPGVNVAALFGLATPANPYSPTVSQQPNDFTIGIGFSGGGIDVPAALAVDANGSVWIANNTNAVSELSSQGVAISPAAGYSTKSPSGVAIDTAGNVWVTNGPFSTVSELSNSTGANLIGSPFSISTKTTSYYPYYIAMDAGGNAWIGNNGFNSQTMFEVTAGLGSVKYFTGVGGLSDTYGIAVDGSGNVWAANNQNSSVSEFTNAGVAVTGANGDTNGSIYYPRGVAIDATGNVWLPNFSNNLTVLNQSGAAVISNGTAGAGGLADPSGVAIDGAGNAWVVNASTYGSNVSAFTGAGTPITPAFGYSNKNGSTGLLNAATAIALDGSGNAWVANTSGNNVVELIGVSVPVITPIAAGLPVVPTLNGTSSLGTRP